MIEVEGGRAGQRGAVYFELSAGGRTLRLITDELFELSARQELVVTIGDDTVAHNAPLEVEGAVARLARSELAKQRRISG